MPYTLTYDQVAGAISGGAAKLARLAPGDTTGSYPLVTAAVAIASSEFDEYGRRRGLVMPFAEPLQPIFQRWLTDLTLDWLTRTMSNREEWIADNAVSARAELEKMAVGQQSVRDNTGAEITGGVGEAPFTEFRSGVLDTENPDSAINRLFPPLSRNGCP